LDNKFTFKLLYTLYLKNMNALRTGRLLNFSRWPGAL